jgi:outer membrane protein OmpA-like peptidoglycan-associated protein
VTAEGFGDLDQRPHRRQGRRRLQRLSERRAQSIKAYLVDNFALSAANLRTVGYGKSHLKNASDPFAAENRRVEVVNMVSQAQVQR